MPQIPVIMLTARGYHLEPQDTEQSGILKMLSKPFSPRQLLATVNEVLESNGKGSPRLAIKPDSESPAKAASTFRRAIFSGSSPTFTYFIRLLLDFPLLFGIVRASINAVLPERQQQLRLPGKAPM